MATALVEEGGSAPPAPPRPTLRIRGHEYPVVLPRLRDPRLALAATVGALQVLGQTVLGFDLSIAQILLSIGTCAVLEVAIAMWDRKEVIWPASAMQTGNGIALIMRVPGTEHGDWWSTRGWSLFVGVAAFSVLSKYVLRWGDRHLFNPSNLGLVAAFVVLGTSWADPQDLWWGPLAPPVIAALVVIAVGGVMVTYRARVLTVAAAFYLPFAAFLAVLAASGHSITARWSVGPVSDWHFWWIVVTSPEILVFVLFMITDPRTVPKGDVARVAFGVFLAAAATLIIAPFDTEFATKVGILAALVVGCALRPLFERWIAADAGPLRAVVPQLARSPRQLAVGGVAIAALVGVIVVAGGPARDVAGGGLGVVAAGAAGERPDVAVEVTAPITIGQVADVAGSIEEATARRAAEEVLEDLAIEAEALRTGDPDLAATALYGERLATVEQVIAAGGAVTVATYQPEHLTVLLVRGTAGAQSPPQLAVTVFGATTEQEVVDGQPSGSGPRTAEVARTFLVAEGPDGYLIGDDIDAVGDRDGVPI